MDHTPPKHTILVSDSAEIFIVGLAKTIRNISQGYITLHAKNCTEIEAILKEVPVDLIIFEITFLSGKFISQLRQAYPALKLVGYGAVRNCNVIKEFINLGLNGYLFKDDPRKEFVNAIRTVFNNGIYFGHQLQNVINDKMFSDKVQSDDIIDVLTNERYREILYLIYYEQAIKEIADHLRLSIKTVEGYRSKLLKIIGANNMVGLALFAERNEIYTDKDLQKRFNIKDRVYIDS
jgi:DNA-binding NarL/FixJ family response regulator